MVAISDHEFAIFGGQGECGKASYFKGKEENNETLRIRALAHRRLLKDMWVFNVRENAWREVDELPTWPSPRRGHSMVYSQLSHQLVLFGGTKIDPMWDLELAISEIWTFDLHNWEWTQISFSGSGPSPRFEHSATVTESGCEMVVLGGLTNSSMTYKGIGGCESEYRWSVPQEGCFSFHIPSSTWTCIDVRSLGDSAGHLLAYHGHTAQVSPISSLFPNIKPFYT